MKSISYRTCIFFFLMAMVLLFLWKRGSFLDVAPQSSVESGEGLLSSPSLPLGTPGPSPSPYSLPRLLPRRGDRVVFRPERDWKPFLEKFGPDLKPEFSRSGQLISIQGQIGSGRPGSPDFRPEDSQKVISRAREILSAAMNLIGVQVEWPLENPVVQGNQISAQVFFSQTYEGIRVLPVGGVKIELGQHGELLALYSNYAAQVSVINQVRLTSDDARLGASAIFQMDSPGLPPIEGGKQIIWVKGEVGRYAYPFIAKGHQIIIDAQTGKVLSSWDRKQY